MTETGILLYGYDKAHASIIRQAIVSITGSDIRLISATGKEDLAVRQIIGGGDNIFLDGEPKVLMFVGFGDDQLGAALNGFPKDGSVQRPIFCGLTVTDGFMLIGREKVNKFDWQQLKGKQILALRPGSTPDLFLEAAHPAGDGLEFAQQRLDAARAQAQFLRQHHALLAPGHDAPAQVPPVRLAQA